MLDKKRIDEAKRNINAYLREGKVIKISFKDNSIKKILVDNSDESLRVAELLNKGDNSNLWTIVCSYYAMYYISKAVLYEIGYKIGEEISHKVTADALIVYVTDKLKKSLMEEYEEAKEEALELSGNKASELLDDYDREKNKRSRFQYSLTETALKGKANTSLERAKKFILEMKKIL